jgi:hypothetical protein
VEAEGASGDHAQAVVDAFDQCAIAPPTCASGATWPTTMP